MKLPRSTQPYIRMQKGFLYLVAILDWYSRRVLAWELSNTLETSFCLQALKKALDTFGAPEIFNTDQGAQFTSNDFTGVLLSHPGSLKPPPFRRRL